MGQGLKSGVRCRDLEVGVEDELDNQIITNPSTNQSTEERPINHPLIGDEFYGDDADEDVDSSAAKDDCVHTDDNAPSGAVVNPELDSEENVEKQAKLDKREILLQDNQVVDHQVGDSISQLHDSSQQQQQQQQHEQVGNAAEQQLVQQTVADTQKVQDNTSEHTASQTLKQKVETTEQTSEQITEQHSEQITEQTSDQRSTEKTSEQTTTEHTSDQTTDQTSSQTTEVQSESSQITEQGDELEQKRVVVHLTPKKIQVTESKENKRPVLVNKAQNFADECTEWTLIDPSSGLVKSTQSEQLSTTVLPVKSTATSVICTRDNFASNNLKTFDYQPVESSQLVSSDYNIVGLSVEEASSYLDAELNPRQGLTFFLNIFISLYLN